MENINISLFTIFNFAKVEGDHKCRHSNKAYSKNLGKFSGKLLRWNSKRLINELSEILPLFSVFVCSKRACSSQL